MRWLTFALLGVIAICFQTTISSRLALYHVRPDFVFILLVHYALHARGSDGPVAGWILGLMMDLTSVEPLGTVSLVYCLMATLIWSIRDLVFTRHPLTHFTLTFVFCAAAQLLLRSHFLLTTAASRSGAGLLVPSLLTGLYTAAWAVAVHQLLLRCAKPLGLEGADSPRARRAVDAF